MKKNIITLLILIFFATPGFSLPMVQDSLQQEANKQLEACATFDWISKTQMQRDANIKQIQSILFDNKTIPTFTKKEFKNKYKEFKKNANYLKDYEEISGGKKEDAEKYYCGFFINKLMIAYGIQYKNNMKNIYYYDAMGNLRWIDVFSENYPKFPYWSYQYYRNGEFIAAYYYVSNDDQYVYDSNKNFRGRWYKERLYNRKAKIIMTRTNW